MIRFLVKCLPRHLRRASMLRPRDLYTVRREVADRYISGQGIEIGALVHPLHVPEAARVRYVDRMDALALREQYPEMAEARMVDVDCIDNGETLATFTDGSEDFVISNHVIEHMEDPLGAMENWLRVLKPGGVLYCALPDKRKTFDVRRPLTTLDHLLRDRLESPTASRHEHFLEYVTLVDNVPEPKAAEAAAALQRRDYSIHYHVWTAASFLEVLGYMHRETQHPFDLELVLRNDVEVIVILRRQHPDDAQPEPV